MYNIPSGWESVRIGNLVEQVERWENVEKHKPYRQMGVKWYAQGVFERETKKGSQIKAVKLCRIEKGDFVYNRLFAWKGSFALVTESQHGGYVSGEFPIFSVKKAKADSNFLLYYFSRPIIWDKIELQSTGTSNASRFRWKEGDFTSFPLLLPPLPEQRKIAEVLGSVDEVIEKTKAVIGQLKAVKQALLEALLTCGLDTSGHLRNPLKSSHLFKQSPLGLIPKEWEVDKLGSVCARSGGSIQIGPFGSQLHSSDYREEGIPIMTVEHLGENEIIHQNLPLVGEEDYERLKKYHLKTGDLVFSRVGSIDRCGYVSEKENGWMFSGRCLRVRVGMKLIGSKFLSHQLNNTTHRNWILKHSVGSTMHCLNTTILSNVPVIIPPFPEQKEFEIIIDANIQRIMTEESKLDQLEVIKNGLMSILLTGEKRVKV